MQNNLYTGKGLLYENYRRGIGSLDYGDNCTTIHQSIHISIPVSIKATITITEEDDELRPLFVKAF